MNKKIKVIELLSEISKGKNPTFRKHGGTYRDSVWTFIISYFDKQMTHEEIVDLLNSEVEILEDEEEIDINGINELVGNVNVRMNNKTVDAEDLFYTISNIVLSLENSTEKTNQLIKAVKKLDKKINKED